MVLDTIQNFVGLSKLLYCRKRWQTCEYRSNTCNWKV